jgi:hypothetical protein
MASVDISPVYQLVNTGVITVAGGAIAFLVGWASYFMKKYGAPLVDAQLESKASADLNTALQNGVNAALHDLNAWESVHKDVAVKGLVQRWAAQYAIAHAKDAVDRFGLGPDQLAQKALSFLPPPPKTT